MEFHGIHSGWFAFCKQQNNGEKKFFPKPESKNMQHPIKHLLSFLFLISFLSCHQERKKSVPAVDLTEYRNSYTHAHLSLPGDTCAFFILIDQRPNNVRKVANKVKKRQREKNVTKLLIMWTRPLLFMPVPNSGILSSKQS